VVVKKQNEKKEGEQNASRKEPLVKGTEIGKEKM
jgi:hypothetical protein